MAFGHQLVPALARVAAADGRELAVRVGRLHREHVLARLLVVEDAEHLWRRLVPASVDPVARCELVQHTLAVGQSELTLLSLLARLSVGVP